MKAREFNLILFGLFTLLPVIIAIVFLPMLILYGIIGGIVLQYIEKFVIDKFGDKIER